MALIRMSDRDSTAEAIEDIKGWDVYDSNGEDVGDVQDVWVDSETGRARYVEVDLGLFDSKHVMIPAGQIELDANDDKIHVPSMIKADFEAMNRFDADRLDEFSRDAEENIRELGSGDYYGRPDYDTTRLYGKRGATGSLRRTGEAVATTDAAATGASVTTGAVTGGVIGAVLGGPIGAAIGIASGAAVGGAARATVANDADDTVTTDRTVARDTVVGDAYTGSGLTDRPMTDVSDTSGRMTMGSTVADSAAAADMDRTMDRTGDAVDRTMDRTGDAMDRTMDRTEDAFDRTGDAISRGVHRTGDAMERGADEVGDALTGEDGNDRIDPETKDTAARGASVGTGAVSGAVIGGVTGGPIGAVIGGVTGAMVGNAARDAVKNDDSDLTAVPHGDDASVGSRDNGVPYAAGSFPDGARTEADYLTTDAAARRDEAMEERAEDQRELAEDMQEHGMVTADGARIAPLKDLDDYEVADGDPDIRGWGVYGADGQKVGDVNDLLVDVNVMKVRYLDVDLDEIDEAMEDASEDRGDSSAEQDRQENIGEAVEGRHVLIPVGLARLDDEDDHVYIDSMPNAGAFAALPAYDKDRFDRSFEDQVRVAFRNQYGEDRYYDHPDYDYNRATTKRRLSQTTEMGTRGMEAGSMGTSPLSTGVTGTSKMPSGDDAMGGTVEDRNFSDRSTTAGGTTGYATRTDTDRTTNRSTNLGSNETGMSATGGQ